MKTERFLYRHFGKILFAVHFSLGLLLWYQGSRLGLFAPPRPGMDQHTILEAALRIAEGILPQPGKYLYSPAYTLFLGGLAFVTGGKLAAMRLIQLAVSALIPWMIYRSAVYAGAGRKAGAVAGVLWLFCGSALLISLDFLRAAPLALCFITLFYFFGPFIPPPQRFQIHGSCRSHGWTLHVGQRKFYSGDPAADPVFVSAAPLFP